jgi:pyruvate dehydrogenase E2 component (dihydrolipoamide acetyltransferase)
MAAFAPLRAPSTFRRIAAGMWSAPDNPSIYGAMDVDATEALRFIERFRAETGRRLTITHVVARALAGVFKAHPGLNAKVRFGGRLEQRSSVDLFLSVATGGGRDLSGVRVEGADRLTLAEMVDAVERGVRGVRSGDDPSYRESRALFGRLPFFLTRPLLRASDLLTNALHLDLPKRGMPRDPFGTAVITNVGTFGVDFAFAPLLPLGRCAMLLLLSEVKPRPLVVDGEIQVRDTLRLCATFDHRVIDGFQAGIVARELRAAIENPEGAS